MKIKTNINLSGKTSYRIGGRATYYAEPVTMEDVVFAFKHAAEINTGVFILGNGSNLLISDSGIDALVINLSAKFTGEIKWENRTAEVLAGTSLDKLILSAIARDCAGIEELSGIPGTVGGAVVMNAGAFNTDISKTLKNVSVLRKNTLTAETVSASDLSLGYRTSAIKGTGDVVLSATFEFFAGDKQELTKLRKSILKKRREKQPLEYPSCGSVFKRPPGNYAGTLIESCGLKGFTIGGAQVSTKHANFIVNIKNATAKDVKQVIEHVQKTVYEKHGISLEPEVLAT